MKYSSFGLQRETLLLCRVREANMKRNKEKLCSVLHKLVIIVVILCFLGGPQAVQAATAKLTAPKTVKTTIASSSSIKIAWSKVTGASGYQIYRATSTKGTYKLVKTTTAGIYSYNNTKLTPGKTYYYKVRAYKTSGKSKIYGSYSKIISGKITPASASNLKVKLTSYEDATLTWGTVKYVSGYQVYMATSSSGKYALVKQTKNNSYNLSGLEPGKTYYYKVRGYISSGSSKVYGGFSTVATAKPILPVPESISVLGSVEGIIDVSWEPSDASDGYEVYRSSSKSGSYQLLTSVSDAGYADTGLVLGSTYYYKVRAYRMMDKTKVYSQYTAATEGNVPNPNPNVTLVTLEQSDMWMVVGGTEQLNATISPQDAADQELTWTSSNEDVAMVDEWGTVSALGEGTATISVAVDSGKQAKCNITVEKANIKGIDVSKWQGNIDWSKVKNDGIEFAMIRSSYGTSSLDPKYEINYKGAKDNGIAVGVYHYSYATTVATAKKEVDFLIKTLEGKQFEYPICLDLEDKAQIDLDKKILADIALVYFDALTEAGYYPMLYSSKGWFTGKLYDSSLDVFDRWVAQWSSKLTYTGEVGMWQYSATGSVSGISGNVDLDISFIDYESRIRWLGLNGY
jgi:GH25 family lysozyme M1 (1,4-beta-N-acetylmuramidase)